MAVLASLGGWVSAFVRHNSSAVGAVTLFRVSSLLSAFPSAMETLFQATLLLTDARDSASDADDDARGPGRDGLFPRHEDVLRHAGARLARRPLLRRPRLPPGVCASPARSL